MDALLAYFRDGGPFMFLGILAGIVALGPLVVSGLMLRRGARVPPLLATLWLGLPLVICLIGAMNGRSMVLQTIGRVDHASPELLAKGISVILLLRILAGAVTVAAGAVLILLVTTRGADDAPRHPTLARAALVVTAVLTLLPLFGLALAPGGQAVRALLQSMLHLFLGLLVVRCVGGIETGQNGFERAMTASVALAAVVGAGEMAFVGVPGAFRFDLIATRGFAEAAGPMAEWLALRETLGWIAVAVACLLPLAVLWRSRSGTARRFAAATALLVVLLPVAWLAGADVGTLERRFEAMTAAEVTEVAGYRTNPFLSATTRSSDRNSG